MSENSVLATKFYLTARAFEQLNSTPKNTEEKKEAICPENYISTTSNEMCTGKEENKTITYNAYAGFSLNKSDVIKNYNNFIRKIETDKKSA